MSARRQGMPLVTAICSFVAVVLIVQIWLLSASLEAFLGGNRDILGPAALASLGLFSINGALLVRLVKFDRRTRDPR